MAATLTDTLQHGFRHAPSDHYWTSSLMGDLSACEELVATPGAGKRLVLEYVWISGAATAVTIGAGESGDTVEATLLGPILGISGAGHSGPGKLAHPVALPEDKSLTADAVAATTVSVIVQGYTVDA